MSDFGDSEVEDAWDPDDAVVDLLRNLLRRLALLDLAVDVLELVGGAAELLDEIDQRAHWHAEHRDMFELHDRQRVDMLLDDIITVRERINGDV